MENVQTVIQAPNRVIKRRRIGGDRYRNEVIALLTYKGYAVRETTYTQDMHEASDLLVNGQGCALRVRSDKALSRWPDDITLRATRPLAGCKPLAGCRGERYTDTEFMKIMRGHAKYALFGFADRDDKIVLMRLLDMDVFREGILSNPEKYDQNERRGADDVGYFVFNIQDFPSEFVLNAWDYRH